MRRSPCSRVYKFVTDDAIAKAVAGGVYRFYELTKYIRMEDDNGRADAAECSVSFSEDELKSFPSKLPVGSFNGAEFYCASIKPDDAYIRQYFVFCTSLAESDVLGDARYSVELETDVFDTLGMLLNLHAPLTDDGEGLKRFSHGPVEYYDVHRHPTPLSNDRWREVFSKHASFGGQQEYRAALFASARFFGRVADKPLVLEQDIFDEKGSKKDFKLRVLLTAGADAHGWRYLEIDTVEFARNMGLAPNRIISVGRM